MSDSGTLSLGSPVTVVSATQVRRGLMVTTDLFTGKVLVTVRASLCDAKGKSVVLPANWSKSLADLPQAAQDAVAAALSACYDAANAADPAGFPK